MQEFQRNNKSIHYSIPLQKERMKAFCVSKGWTDITEYVDGGYSGSNLNRPALQQLQKDIELKKINAVIVYRLDRLSRSQRDTLFLIEEMFLPNNVEFISISETIDTSIPFGRCDDWRHVSLCPDWNVRRLLNVYEVDDLKWFVMRGFGPVALMPVPMGIPDLKRGKLVVNEEERQHIVRIFEEYVTLKSYIKVQKKLEKEGFKPLEDYRITKLLRNRLYIGEVSFAGRMVQRVT